MTRVSIKKIAELSGVSVATVSRVINNNGRFSEETRKKVMKVVKETGYNPNSVAKSLRMKKSYTIGIVVPDITNYFFSDIVQKIEEQLFSHSYSTIICNTGRNNEKELMYLNMLQSKMIDGLIVISGIEEFDLKGAITKNIPVVCIDRKPKNPEQTLFISSDHYSGAKEATELLLDKGVKNPVILKHDRQSSSSIERLEAFVDALEERNIPFDESAHVIEVETHGKSITKTETFKTFNNFFENKKKVDGIFAINDQLALYSIEVLKNHNLNIPKDVKVIGFDNTPLAKHTTPTLSSVKQHTDKLAELTCTNLLNLLDKKQTVSYENLVIPVELVERETT